MKKEASGIRRCWYKPLGAAIALTAALLAQATASTMPSTKIGTAALIAPSAAESYYSTSTTSDNSIGTKVYPNEIVELAKALHNNVDEIYDFVSNYIDTVFIFGAQKGALGALVDKSGTPFDQAELMVELLVQSGYSASYKFGTVTLTGAQFAAWTHITNAQAACNLLASGGIPAYINGSTASLNCSTISSTATVSSVQMDHVWVAVVIGSSTYVFDPSYKAYDFRSSVNLASAAGLTTGQGLTAATAGSTTGTSGTVGYVQSVNSGSLNSQLTTYAGNLQNFIQTQSSVAATPVPLISGQIKDLVGGGDIHRQTVPTGGQRITSLPYPSAVTRTWAPAALNSGTSNSGIPNQFRATLRVQLTYQVYLTDTPILDKTLYADDIYGRKLTYTTNFDPNTFGGSLTLVDEFGNSNALSTYTQSQNPGFSYGTITLSVNHPYAADPTGTGTGGTYMDESVSKPISYSTPFTIVNAWGDANKGLIEKWGTRLDTPMPIVAPNGCDTCTGLFRANEGDARREQLAASWIVQSSKAARLHAEIAQSIFALHHAIGIVSGDSDLRVTNIAPQGQSPIYRYSVQNNLDRIDIETGFSVTSMNADPVARRAAVHAIAATQAALEGSVEAQNSDLPDTVSVATRFQWGNSPPASEDPSGVGARAFFEFNSTNGSNATSQVLPLMLVEGATSTTSAGINTGGEPVLSSSEYNQRRNMNANAIADYATAGFTVIAPGEAFLGPGQRGGAYQGTVGNYTNNPSMQRGGAMVATLYDTNGLDPLEIAHVAVNDATSGIVRWIKGGGGGAQVYHQSQYDPATAADILKAKFVDRSKVEGVDLLSGAISYESPAVLDVGNGGFPYELTGKLIWRGGSVTDVGTSPTSHVQPQAPWTTNWNNNLTISGSALEAMGETDIRASAGTVAAFLALQDMYKQPVSRQREVAAVLVASWWVGQVTGNVATVSVGANTRQFVKRYDGTWVAPGPGEFATLTQTGSRTPRTLGACGGGSPSYVLTRGWDYSSMSFTVTGAHGDVQTFPYWANTFMGGAGSCAYLHGFRLSKWTFPQGVTINLVYGPTSTSLGVDQLLEVNNSLGRKLELVTSGLGGFSNDLTGSDARSISFSESVPGGTSSTMTITDAANAVTTVNHIVTGYQNLISQVFDANNTSTPALQYTYNTLLRISQVQDAEALQVGDRNPYQYLFAEGARSDRLDPAGGQYTAFFDTYRRPLEYLDELGRATWVSVDGRNRITGYTYPEGDQQVLSYDDLNNTTSLTRVPVPGSSLVSTQVRAQWDQTWNKPLHIWDALNNETDFTYFPSGSTGASLLNTATRPSPDGTQPRPVYTLTYTPIGRLYTSTDPTNVVTSNTYDSSGNLQTTTLDPSGVNATTTYGYDANGNQISVMDPRTYVTENIYDLDRRKKTVLHHNGNISAPVIAAEQTQYDVLGRVQENDGGTGFSGTSVTTWQMLKSFTYTPTGKVLTETDGANDKTIYTYDPMDRTVIVQDPALRRVATVYDLAGEALSTWRGWNSSTPPTISTAWNPTAYPGSGPIRYGAYTYFPDGEQATVTDANNNLTSMTYDGFQRLWQVYYPVATSGALSWDSADFEVYGYDKNDNRTSVQRRDGQVINYHFDYLNRQTIKDLPGTTTGDIYSGYDLAGRPKYDYFGSTTGQGVAYNYDTAGRLWTETEFGRQMTYQYDLSSNRSQVTWPDGNYITYLYDALNRVSQIEENGATSGPGLLAVYSYDSLSRVWNIAYGNGTATSMGYDAASRLQSLGQDFAGAAQDLTLGFHYTPASQLQIRSTNNPLYEWFPAAASTSYVPDGLNRYSGVSYGYDTRENLTSNGVYTYTYDVENRLLTASGPTAVNLSYDPLGRLQQTQTSGGTTQYLYAGTQLVAEYDGSGNVLRRYVFGPGDGDDPLVWYEGANLSKRYDLHADERGSIIAVSDSSGSATPYIYGPYGEQSSWSGSRFRYTGQMEIPEANLYYYKARVYSPTLGRFLQTDPIGGKDDLNLYAYVKNDPLDGTDPTGNDDSPWSMAQAAANTTPQGTVAMLGGIADGLSIGGPTGEAKFFGDPSDPSVQSGYRAGTLIASGITFGLLGASATSSLAEAEAIPSSNVVARGGADITPESIVAGTGNTSVGRGFSANSAATLPEAATDIKNNKVGVTTAGDIRAAGGQVHDTPNDRNPTHVTVTGLKPEDASRLLSPSVPNPVPKCDRRCFQQ